MLPSPEQVRAKVGELAVETLDREEPLPDGDLSEHLDSVDRLALVVAIEDHYEICFDDDDDAGVHTVDDVVRIILAKLADPGRA
jgi:acyl carrier protein